MEKSCNITPEALKFLKKVLEVDPYKHLNPQQIWQEPWLKLQIKIPPPKYTKVHPVNYYFKKLC